MNRRTVRNGLIIDSRPRYVAISAWTNCLRGLALVAFTGLLPAGYVWSSGMPTEQRYHQFERISVEQGMPTNTVTCILQDKRGFLWFGTHDGLARYDGYNFKVYANDPDDPSSLADNRINALVEDDAATIWVATKKGLYTIDPITEAISKYPIREVGQSDVIQDFSIRSLTKDHMGHLWLGSSTNGLTEINAGGEIIARYTHDPSDSESLSSDGIYALYDDSRQNLWVGTNTGLDRLDRETGVFHHHAQYLANDDTEANKISAIYEDRSGAVWFGAKDGLFKFDPETGNFSHFQHREGDNGSLSENDIRSLWEDTKGILWIGTNRGGLNSFDPERKVFSQFPRGNKEYPIFSLCKDRSGVLWIGTDDGGLLKMKPQNKPFRHWVSDPEVPGYLNSSHVTAVFEDRSGNLWFGTDDSGLNRYDQKSKTFTYYRRDQNNTNSLRSDRISAIVEDDQGLLWFGMKTKGLVKFDPNKEIFTSYRNDPADERSLSDDRVRSLFVDSKGKVWIGCNGGLQQFDQKTDRFNHHLLKKDGELEEKINKIRHIYEDTTGMFWIATDGGLVQFDPQTGRLENLYEHEKDNPNSLSINLVRLTHESADGTFWIGTRGGLNKLDPQTKQFTRYTEEDGLASNVVYGILEDDEGNLWISTANGLSQFNTRQESFVKYGLEEGLLNAHFEKGAFLRARNGEMFFGGLNGMDSFFPEQIVINRHIPPVIITSFKIFGQPVIFEKAFSQLEGIELSHEDRFITFEFAALDYVNPEMNQYAYKLEGFDPVWINIGIERQVSYSNLDPGDYVLRIRGSNNDGIWNEKGVSLNLHITPAYWATWWFRLLGLGVVVAVVALVTINIVLRRKRVQLVEVNTKLAKEILARQEKEKNLRQNESRYRTLFENSPNSVWEEDFSNVKIIIDGLREEGVSDFRIYFNEHPEAIGHCLSHVKIIDINQATLRLYKAESKEALFRELGGIFTAKSMEVFKEELIALCEGRTTFKSEMFSQAIDGSEVHKEVLLVIVPGYEETWAKVLISDYDITELKRIEQKLRVGKEAAEEAHRLSKISENLRIAKEAAEESNKAKSQFLSHMSHELRTPLSSIIGFSDLLLAQISGFLNAKQNLYVEKIDESGKHLLSLINDLLDISKIDAGEMDTDLELFPFKGLIDATVSLLDTQFKTKKLQVNTSVGPSLEMIWGDVRKCRQILLNLLSNAIKYTPEMGRIDILAKREGDSDVRISVRDNGVGIPSEELDKIFSEFHQVDSVRDESMGGTGIGLALTRRLVELHNGNIGVQSTPGVGSTFWFTLPGLEKKPVLAATSDPKNEHNDTATLRERRILVVEDNEMLLTMIQDMLSSHDHEVAVARNGQLAIEVARKHRPELILMDMRMPVMGGLEATEKLRGIPEFSEIPIIALTANTGKESMEKQFAAGCTDHLAKPIISDDLFAILEKYLSKSAKRELV